MSSSNPIPNRGTSFLARHSVFAYFALTFTISWLGAFAVASPHLLRHEPLPQLTGILMFPAMLLGPSIAGVFLTRIVDGKAGLRDLGARLIRGNVSVRWYAPLLIPPALILTVLFCLKTFVSPVYTPNFFLIGFLFGIPAGFLEEMGWMGFAFPKMRSQQNAVAPAILLGLLWATWHLPVINYLGTATPHGRYWFPFFLAFTAAMTAMRVLICWNYSNTKSVLLAQFMHISSTSSLVIFSAPRASARQEVVWYAVYAIALWLVVVVVAAKFSRRLTRRST
jgi:uncharacterized protein